MFYVIKKQGSFLRFLGGRDEARKGGCVRPESQDATDGSHFEEKKNRKYNKYEENGRQIIRKCEILKQNVFLGIKNLTEMSTTRSEHLSFTAIRNDQKWRTRRGDRSSSNIAHSDAGRPELRDVPHGMFGNMNFTRQRGDK